MRRRTNRRRPTVRALTRAVETKNAETYNLGLNIYSSQNPLFPSGNQIVLGPNSGTMQIPQGVFNGYRIGNKITTKRLILKGTLHPLPFQTTTNPTPVPQQIRMLVYYDRSDPNVVPNPSSDMFQNNNTNGGFLNQLSDLWRPYNTDKYRILLQRTFKLGFAYSEGSGSSPDYQGLSNNDFKLNCNFSIDLTKYYPKTVKFDENNLQPTTRGLFVLFYACAASGGATPAAVIPAAVEYMFRYTYTDM